MLGKLLKVSNHRAPAALGRRATARRAFEEYHPVLRRVAVPVGIKPSGGCRRVAQWAPSMLTSEVLKLVKTDN